MNGVDFFCLSYPVRDVRTLVNTHPAPDIRS